MSGEELSVSPTPDCNCPEGYPIFERWVNFKTDPWRGLYCLTVDGSSTISRFVLPLRNQPQVLTDGDYSDYWISALDTAENKLHKLTIDLGASYQVIDLICNMSGWRSWKRLGLSIMRLADRVPAGSN